MSKTSIVLIFLPKCQLSIMVHFTHAIDQQNMEHYNGTFNRCLVQRLSGRLSAWHRVESSTWTKSINTPAQLLTNVPSFVNIHFLFAWSTDLLNCLKRWTSIQKCGRCHFLTPLFTNCRAYIWYVYVQTKSIHINSITLFAQLMFHILTHCCIVPIHLIQKFRSFDLHVCLLSETLLIAFGRRENVV